MAKTSFYSGSGADSNDVSALENLKNQAQTSATAAAASASSAAASVASLNEDVATQSTKGLMSAADKTKLDGVESSADVTDTANVTAAGALMDSEVTSLSGIKTLTVPDSTTVSTFGASLVDDADAAAARTTLGLGTAATTASTAYATAAQGTTADAALPKAGGTMTGAITFASGQTFDGRDVSADGTKLDTIETNADVTDATNVQAAGALMDSELTSEASVKAINQGVATTDSPTFAGLTTTADVSFGDNDKAIFGAGSDLQIYHTGSTSVIKEGGTGDLLVQAQNFYVQNVAGTQSNFYSIDGGATGLAYAGAVKLATTSTGVDITGTLTSDGLTVDGLAKIQGVSTGLLINETDTTDVNSYLTTSGGVLKIFTTNDAFSSFTERMRVNHATGDISFYEDTGTTAKFFWDASAESLGIGGPPSELLEVSANKDAAIKITSTDTALLTGETIGSIKFESKDASGTPPHTSAQIDVIAEDVFGRGAMAFSTGRTGDFKEGFRLDSSGNVGIGTTSPTAVSSYKVMHFKGGATNNGGMIRMDTSDTSHAARMYVADALYFDTITSSDMVFKPNNTERMRIDSSGNVGIGTSSPSSFYAGANNLVVGSGSGEAGMTFYSGTTSDANIYFADGTAGTAAYRGYLEYKHTSDYMRFGVAGTEAMRIDSSGNLLVGTTSSANTTEGLRLKADFSIAGARDGAGILYLNRLTSDGDIINLQRDGSQIGGIGVTGYDLYVGTTDTGLRFVNSTDSIEPVNISTQARRDASIDFGSSGYRFKDLYLSGGVFLGGTGAANKLDDYEEGTFTPNLRGSGSNPTATYSQRYGYYTKVGRMVYISLRVRASAYSGGSGNLQIDGLPFTPNTGAQHNIGGTFVSGPSWGTDKTQFVPWVLDNGQAKVQFRGFQNNAGNYDLTVSDYSANDYIDVNGWYFT